MDISVIIPLYNEVESIEELTLWIDKVISAEGLSYEIILIDDGSEDGSWNKIIELSKTNSFVKGIKFKRNYGKSAAINVGFSVCKGEVIITMDADLQDNPDEIPYLYKMIKVDGFDLVSGWKKKRYDPPSKTIPTKLFNWATRKMSGIKLHDFNCGLKAYKREVVKSIEIYGEMHRYIPVIAKWAGFKKIGEKVVAHQPRKYGKSKFGFNRFINGFLDLLSISFTSRFSKKPMHFFGTLGTITFIFGFIIAVYLAIAKIFFEAYKMTERPLFYLGILAMIIGTQLFLTGFIADMISRISPDRNKYIIESTTYNE
ncbi:MAG TPA: glycosyltransferase family 2 protein [Bacteroidales bacterium]|nr:glycosyltransferase family 2 protein [Bacteroidales bacterium]